MIKHLKHRNNDQEKHDKASGKIEPLIRSKNTKTVKKNDSNKWSQGISRQEESLVLLIPQTNECTTQTKNKNAPIYISLDSKKSIEKSKNEPEDLLVCEKCDAKFNKTKKFKFEDELRKNNDHLSNKNSKFEITKQSNHNESNLVKNVSTNTKSLLNKISERGTLLESMKLKNHEKNITQIRHEDHTVDDNFCDSLESLLEFPDNLELQKSTEKETNLSKSQPSEQQLDPRKNDFSISKPTEEYIEETKSLETKPQKYKIDGENIRHKGEPEHKDLSESKEWIHAPAEFDKLYESLEPKRNSNDDINKNSDSVGRDYSESLETSEQTYSKVFNTKNYKVETSSKLRKSSNRFGKLKPNFNLNESFDSDESTEEFSYNDDRKTLKHKGDTVKKSAEESDETETTEESSDDEESSYETSTEDESSSGKSDEKMEKNLNRPSILKRLQRITSSRLRFGKNKSAASVKGKKQKHQDKDKSHKDKKKIQDIGPDSPELELKGRRQRRRRPHAQKHQVKSEVPTFFQKTLVGTVPRSPNTGRRKSYSGGGLAIVVQKHRVPRKDNHLERRIEAQYKTITYMDSASNTGMEMQDHIKDIQ